LAFFAASSAALERAEACSSSARIMSSFDSKPATAPDSMEPHRDLDSLMAVLQTKKYDEGSQSYIIIRQGGWYMIRNRDNGQTANNGPSRRVKGVDARKALSQEGRPNVCRERLWDCRGGAAHGRTRKHGCQAHSTLHPTNSRADDVQIRQISTLMIPTVATRIMTKLVSSSTI